MKHPDDDSPDAYPTSEEIKKINRAAELESGVTDDQYINETFQTLMNTRAVQEDRVEDPTDTHLAMLVTLGPDADRVAVEKAVRESSEGDKVEAVSSMKYNPEMGTPAIKIR
jgi:hypothetical protein